MRRGLAWAGTGLAAAGAAAGLTLATPPAGADSFQPVTLQVAVTPIARLASPLLVTVHVSADPGVLDTGQKPMRIEAKLATECGGDFQHTTGVTLVDAPLSPQPATGRAYSGSASGAGNPAAYGTETVCVYLEDSSVGRVYGNDEATQAMSLGPAPRPDRAMTPPTVPCAKPSARSAVRTPRPPAAAPSGSWRAAWPPRTLPPSAGSPPVVSGSRCEPPPARVSGRAAGGRGAGGAGWCARAGAVGRGGSRAARLDPPRVCDRARTSRWGRRSVRARRRPIWPRRSGPRVPTCPTTTGSDTSPTTTTSR